MQKLFGESSFKVLYIESKNGMVLIVRKKIQYDDTLEQVQEVYQFLTRKLENLSEILKDA